MIHRIPKQYTSGQAMLIAVVFFLIISMTIVIGIASPILRQVKNSQDLIRSKESYYLAEGALEDALYQIKTGKSVVSGDTIVVNGYTTTLNVTSIANGKIINATTDRAGYFRKVEAKVNAGVGVAFNYGVQTGTGGVVMNNNAGIVGNVYANGDISGSSGSYITGSAYAANTAALTANQTNDTPTPITCGSSNCITFDNAAATEDFAQSFQVTETSPINKVALYLKRTSSSPSNLTVRIVTDNAGSPSTNTLDSVTLNASSVTTNFGWIEAVFPNNPELVAGTTYWLVLDGSYNSTKYYTIGANSAYSSGQAKIGRYTSTWTNTSPSGLDGYFKIYLGGLTAVISNVVVGTGSTGDAWAHTVTNSTVRGSLYCQTGSGNNKACNTTRPDPSPQGFPVSDANIEQWKEDAEAGGITTGNVSISASSASTNARKITGNLTIGNNSSYTINGTLWIEGNLTLDNGSVIRLGSGYGPNSGVIVVDGRVTVRNNSNFYGSGQTGSYVMVVSTSDCPTSAACNGSYAIDVSNNAGTVIMNAQKGTIRFQNNAGAKEATANKIYLDNNSQVIYESGLADLNFTSGPTGGWEITSWQEVQ